MELTKGQRKEIGKIVRNKLANFLVSEALDDLIKAKVKDGVLKALKPSGVKKPKVKKSSDTDKKIEYSTMDKAEKAVLR